jgi:hypothetical protein
MLGSVNALSIILVLNAAGAALSQTPSYQTSLFDATWTPIGGGAYQVSTSAENYAYEVWERPVEDSKWSISADTITTTGKYYAYGDLQQAGFGLDAIYLYASFTSAGDFIHEVGQSPTFVGLKARYNFYFGVAGDSTKQFLLTIDDGSSVGTGSFGSIGKVYQDANGNVLGSGLTITLDSSGGAEQGLSDGFEAEIATGSMLARRTGTTIELAVPYASLGLNASDFSQLAYAYAGLTTSNPSSPTNLFVNDQFSAAAGSGVEYDTLALVPEPGSSVLALSGALILFGISRRREPCA